MTRRPVFECDGCGERHGYLNEMCIIPMRFAPPDIWAEVEDEELHACISCWPGRYSELLDVVDRIGYTLDGGPVIEAVQIGDDWYELEECDLGNSARAGIEYIEEKLL